MGYVIFRGIGTEGSASVVGVNNVLANVYVNRMPDHKRAAKRMAEYHVKGRDGALHVDEGFDNFDITVKLVLINATAATRQLVNAWADGTGKLVTSDDLTKCYKATVMDEVEWSRKSANGGYYDVATVTFNCQPFMYETVDSVVEITSNLTGWINPGTSDAYPLIKIEGTDTEAVAFDFCGEYLVVYGIDPNNPVYIDCENGYIYTEDGTSKSVTGKIPKIPLGVNGVYFNPEHPPTKLTVTPHWRWV